MRGDDDPGAALADGAEVFGDGLQGQHQLGVAADELANLVDQKQHAVFGRLGFQVFIDPAAEVFHGDAEGLLGVLEPLVRGLGGEVEGRGYRLFDVVLVELVTVTLLHPLQPGGLVEGLFEALVDATLAEVAFHVGDVRVIAAEAPVLVEHAQEYVEDRVAGIVGAGFAVDVEQDDIGGIGHGLVDVGADHGIAQLVAIEEAHGLFAVAQGITRFDVGQQVGQGFQKVRLTGAEETADPHTNAVGDGGVVEVCAVGIEETAKMPLQFVGDDVFVQLLVHGGVVRLIRLDHAVDGAAEILEEDVFDAHYVSSLIIREPA
ncbi:hypothetical protein D3C85_740370 [compost metagenome]